MSCFDDLEICWGMLEALPAGLSVVDLQKKIVIWSAGAERITGHLRHEVVGFSCVSQPQLHCDQPHCEFCREDSAVAKAIKTAQPAEAMGFLHHKAGHEVPVRIHAVPVHNLHGSIIGIMETFEETNQAVHQDPHEFIQRSSANCLDGITGIGTHAMTELYLRQAAANFSQSRIPFGLLMLRVERLTHFRKSFGPEAASCLLRATARTLEGVLSINDFVGRWDEDRFLVILTVCREESLYALRELVRHTLAGKSIEWWGEHHSLPVSIGEAVAQPGDTAESVLKRAQTMLDLISIGNARAAIAASTGS
jgi:diguanylate cyclase (GGDEF)-like protein/PAS domain S-box-containing protein